MTRNHNQPPESHGGPTTWHDLPTEIIVEMVQYLWTRDALALSSTCRLHHSSLSDMILTRYIRLNPSARVERLLAQAVDHNSVSFAQKVLSLGGGGGRIVWAGDITVRTPSRVQPVGRSRAPLLRAVQRGNADMVDVLLRYGADVLSRTEDDTAMSLALRLNSLDIAARLLEYAASLPAGKATNTNDGDKLQEENVSVASLLANSRPIDFQIHALHHAARAGRIPPIQLLLEHGAHIDARDDKGNTALHMALARTKIAAARVLLRHGADVEVRNNARRDALSLAARMPGATTEERAGLVQEIIDISRRTATHAADDGDDDDEGGRLRGMSDAQASELLASGQASIVRLVLDAGYHPDCTPSLPSSSSLSSSSSSSSFFLPLPKDQGTPLWRCSSLRAPPWGDGPADTHGVKLLLDAGADVNSAHPVTLETPVMRAARHGRDDVLRLLVSRGADVSIEARDQGGKTVLAHAATARTGIKPLRTLLDDFRRHRHDDDESLSPSMAAQLETRDTRDRTPLIQALQAGRFTPAAMLISAGADVVRPRDEHGRSALHLAAQRHPLFPVELILARLAADGVLPSEGIDAVVTNNEGHADLGETPLVQAVRWNCRAAALLLIAEGADVNVARTCREMTYPSAGDPVARVVHEWYETPLTTAVRRDDVVLVRALLQAGASVRRAVQGDPGLLRKARMRPALGDGSGDRGKTRQVDDGETVVELLKRFGALEDEAEGAARGESEGDSVV